MKHIYKVRIFNQTELTFRYPDSTGHFYVHRVDNLLVFDNNLVWNNPEKFIFVPAILQQYYGMQDKYGNELYEGDIPVYEILHKLIQHEIWLNSLNY